MSDFDIKKSSDSLKVRIFLNASSKEQLNTYLAKIKNKIEHSEYSKELVTIKFDFQKDMPVFFTPLNDEVLAHAAMKSISGVYGAQSVIPLYGVPPLPFSDDFAYFQEQVPGVYFFLGVSNSQKGIAGMPHTPNFEADEESIRTGVNYFSSMIIERLQD